MKPAPYTRNRQTHNYGGGVLVTPTLRLEAACLAARTTAKSAARQFHVSPTSVGKWLKAAGLKARRACRPTDREFESYGKEYVSP